MNALSFRAAGLLAGLALLASSCGSNSGGGGILFESRSTKQGVTQLTPIVISERWLAFLADEASTGAGGTDFNGDGDVIDQVAVLVNMASQKETVLDVAAQELVMLGGRLFLVTSEAADGKDWDLDGMADDLVLLHVDMQTATPATVAYVATLNPATAPHALAANGRLYFVDIPAAPLVAPDTALRYVTAAAPTDLNRVANLDAANTLEAPRLHAEDSGLLFLTLDENVEGRDLNADTDMTDGFVLALVDATDPAAMVQSTGLAVRDGSSPVEALPTDPGDWLVAFLVDEAAQGMTNLNDPTLFGGTWEPTQCAATPDVDALDQVLHYLNFQLWTATPMAVDALENTGLAGADRVLALRTQSMGDFVATISPEDEANCDLNGDGDTLDRIFRWTLAQNPVLPFTNQAQLYAVADVAGNARGISDLTRRFLIVVSEADQNDDIDGDGMMDHDLVAWLNPALGNGATWIFDHNGPSAPNGFVGTAWMSDREQRDRLLVAFQEEVAKLQINPNGDGDMLDSAATAARFDPTNLNDLDFPGPMVAIDDDNAGIAIENGLLFYRVDELADNRDWNGDGMKNDFVLFRTTLATLQNSSFIASLNGIARPAVATGGNVGVAYVADETMGVANGVEGVDYNMDGDKNDFVVRWFRIGP